MAIKVGKKYRSQNKNHDNRRNKNLGRRTNQVYMGNKKLVQGTSRKVGTKI
jgi:hypothetical protein